MERGVTIGVGAVVLGLMGLVAWRGSVKKNTEAHEIAVADASVTAAAASGDDASLAAFIANLPSAAGDAASAPPSDDVAPGTRLPNGEVAPALPEKAPRAVRCGVVLVTYQGAQDAPKNARPKAEALAMAQKLAADAKTDFHGAVVRGDSGSIDDLGRVPRGVLEPAPEYVLFTLTPGAVSEPVDTPRGFWIVKRIE